MKKNTISILLIASVCLAAACSKQESEPPSDADVGHHDKEKPIQHLKLPDIESSAEAATVFAKEVAFITGKEELDAAAMNEIHLSTYSLEKAVAYYTGNSEGAKKVLADQIAVVVEEIHLASENNRAEETQTYIDQLSELASQF